MSSPSPKLEFVSTVDASCRGSLRDVLLSAIPAKGGLWVPTRIPQIAPDFVERHRDASYADLAEDRLKGEICVRSSTNIYNLSLLSEFIGRNGSEAAAAWAKGEGADSLSLVVTVASGSSIRGSWSTP